jgi:hypothetical protein
MKKIFDRKLIIILLINSFINSFSQTIPNVKSPQTYQIEKFGNIPINKNTGGNAYTVNLYNYSGIYMNENFSINLQYYGTGFVPAKRSNYVGMDWSLDFGGAISREVRGIPDDYCPESTSSDKLYGYLEGVRNCNKTNSQIYGNNYNAGNNGNVKVGINCNGRNFELEPDVFNFNFMDKHGYFYIGNDGVPVIVSDEKALKIDITNLSSKQPLNQFDNGSRCLTKNSSIVITDGQGIKYSFGGIYANLEVSYPMSTDQSIDNKFTITAWNLFKIEYPNTNVVDIVYKSESIDLYDKNFCYDRDLISNIKEPFSRILDYNYVRKQHIRSTNMNYNTSTSWLDYVGGTVHWGNSSSFADSGIESSFNITKKSLPEEIKLNNTPIAFFNYEVFNKYYNGTIPSYKLVSIFLKNQLGNNYKNVALTYYRNKDYFFLDKLKLFLKSKLNPVYEMEYNFDYYGKSTLPDEYTIGIDFWGFWNGKVNNKLVPNFNLNKNNGDYSFSESIRDPDANYANTGLLKSITYPTKGRSEFIYEGHDYSQKVDRPFSNQFKNTIVNSTGIVGGGRIKKIINYSEGNLIADTKEYKYLKNYNPNISNTISSGILSNYYRNLIYFSAKNSIQSLESVDVYSNNIIETAMNSSPVLYSEVTEIQSNGSYIKYYFTGHDSHPDNSDFNKIDQNIVNSNLKYTLGPQNIENINLPYNSFSYKRGKLSKQEFYNDSFVKIRESITEFSDIADVLKPTNYVTHATDRGSFNYYIKQFGGTFVPKKIIEKEYFNGQELTSLNEFTFSQTKPQVLTNIKSINSDGSEINKTLNYSSSADMITANMVEIPVLTEVNKQGVPISKNKTNFSKNWNGHQLLLPSSQQSVQVSKINTPNEVFENDITYDSYDEKGNLLQYTSKDGIPVTILYGYERTLPIAKIEGVAYITLMNDLGISNSTSSYTTLDICQKSNSDLNGSSEQLLIESLDTFRKNSVLSNYSITTYTYDPLVGVTSITPPSGIREVYLYDTANRLKEIREDNATGKILKEFKYNYKP